MTARAQAKLFAPKKFPKGLAAAGQICFQLTPGKKHAVWKDYCELVHPHGPEWKVKYLNDGGILDVPKKELGLALQPGQEMILKGRLVRLSHYAGNKAHFVYDDLLSGDESDFKPEKKRNESRGQAPRKGQSNVAKRNLNESQKKNPLTHPTRPKTQKTLQPSKSKKKLQNNSSKNKQTLRKIRPLTPKMLN